MWTVVAASTIGTSHEKLGLPCQDSSGYLRIKNGVDDNVLIIAIADGAGSAKNSEIGSREMVQHLLALACKSEQTTSALSKEQALCWVHELTAHLKSIAEKEAIQIKDLACTFLFGIIDKSGGIFCQIGDGAWVVEIDGELRAATWPDNGEFANETIFVTSESAPHALQYEAIKGKISGVAGFTDGIQSLALDFSLHKAHEPFFRPLFSAISGCEDETSLIAPLRSFLASEPVITRTDDDKTLVLACWHEPKIDSNGADQ